MSRLRSVYPWLILLGVWVDIGFAQRAPQPFPVTTRPVAVDQARLELALRDLGVGDSTTRDTARATLLELRRADLPALQTAVAKARPLAPGTVAVLQEVVTHVYLREEPYLAHADKSFLGIQMWRVDLYFVEQPVDARPPVPFVDPDRADVPPDADTNPVALRAGVIIERRIPGFCGYGALRDGDVVLALPDLGVAQLTSSQDLMLGVQNAQPGRKVTLRVLRRGQEVDVPVLLDARPVAVDPIHVGSFDELVQQRAESALNYWRDFFAPVVDDVL